MGKKYSKAMRTAIQLVIGAVVAISIGILLQYCAAKVQPQKSAACTFFVTPLQSRFSFPFCSCVPMAHHVLKNIFCACLPKTRVYLLLQLLCCNGICRSNCICTRTRIQFESSANSLFIGSQSIESRLLQHACAHSMN